MKLSVSTESFQLAEAFVISRGSRTQSDVLSVTASSGDVQGRGECLPYARYNETFESVTAQIEALPENITRQELQDAMPAGAARNAVDCALWDLEAKQAGKRVWDLLGLAVPVPVQTAFTLSLGIPGEMQKAAERNAHRPLLKIKLGTEHDIPRLEAVRRGAPKSRIIVDANEGWTADIYAELAPYLVRLGVDLVEQPLPAGDDDMLAEIERPLPVCADESCHDRNSLAGLKGKYDMINIKLDKTGGLTEGLELRRAAREDGFGIMVGCMVGSSLAMAPAVLLAQGARVTDLDAPLLLAEDRKDALHYDGSWVHAPKPALWG